eukprot:TRINITY_DN1344_c4_g1_i1.p1 TRINITY_DN1344_c4_g1~~TRINITY_DN1344_c4_g1_i1.p1  ORF type:complete len:592 (-),score=161.04 TRINITY_DN1344_c4_g1_i1:111-1886(-)
MLAKSLSSVFKSVALPLQRAAAGWSGKRFFFSSPKMFCYQCEQTKEGVGCTSVGICGKRPDVAAAQDVLIEMLKGVSQYAHRARELGVSDPEVDHIALDGLFPTLTNVNFDFDRIEDMIHKTAALRSKAKDLYENKCKELGRKAELLDGPAVLPDPKKKKIVKVGRSFGIDVRQREMGATITGLQELIVYGMKGTAAYAEHARVLGGENPEIFAKIHEIMNFLTTPKAKEIGSLLSTALEVGALNLKVMELLDKSATGKLGDPAPTKIELKSKIGPAILISGHDLVYLEKLLEQTEGTGINVYTHGEMLPAHSYPALHKFKHLVTNYGSAWQRQKKEFEAFPGPIVMTSNCLIAPKKSYENRVFTMGPVGFPGVKHLETPEFGEVIKMAKAMKGFEGEIPIGKGEVSELTLGFGHNTVMSVAGDVVKAVQEGKIKKFFLIGGCDGSETERSYFTDLARNLPEDNVILTLGCGKYRVNLFDYGNVPGTGIPRLLDMGQCNDAFSAIQVAIALVNAFKVPSVNDLPLYFAVSWFEQKAVAILLTLLHLGIKNIHLGPTLPAFLTPDVLKVLIENFNIAPTTDITSDFGIVKKI